MSSPRAISIRFVIFLSLSFAVFLSAGAPVPPPADSKVKAPTNPGEIPFMGRPSETLPDDTQPVTGSEILQRTAPTGVSGGSSRPVEGLADIKPLAPVIDEALPAQTKAVQAKEERLMRGLQMIGGGFALVLLLVGGWYWRRSEAIR
jgi:hypothetical protein